MFDWIISDTHFFHRNIAQYAGRPENHETLIINNWLNTVMPGDTVLHLGDVLMGPRVEWSSLLNLGSEHSLASPHGGEVYVLDSGNHDEPHKREWIEKHLRWKFIPEFSFDYEGWSIHVSHFPQGAVLKENAVDNTDMRLEGILLPNYLNVHGHIHNRSLISPQHINVSVEMIDYTPVRFEQLLDDRIKLLEAKR